MKFEDEDNKFSSPFYQYSYFDWYDSEQFEKLRGERTKKYMTIIRKWSKAKEKGNKEDMAKIAKALAKHRNQDDTLKKKAESAGNYWF